MIKKTVFFNFIVLFIILMPAFVFGEWFGEVYIGMHKVQADNMEIKHNGNTVTGYPDSDTGSIFGGRIVLRSGSRGGSPGHGRGHRDCR